MNDGLYNFSVIKESLENSLFKHYNKPFDKVYIVSSKVDDLAISVIAEFKLPISFIAIDKYKSLTWQGQRKN